MPSYDFTQRFQRFAFQAFQARLPADLRIELHSLLESVGDSIPHPQGLPVGQSHDGGRDDGPVAEGTETRSDVPSWPDTAAGADTSAHVLGAITLASDRMPWADARSQDVFTRASAVDHDRGRSTEREVPNGPTEVLPLPPRFEDLGLLGAGGMGEVHRVRDRVLNRTLALKVMGSGLTDRPTLRVRFLEEAQVASQLQHPGIVPVHDLGQLPDGRMWFTMKEVRGRTLSEVARAVHAASSPDRWGVASGEEGAMPWTFRGLIDAFHKTCEAVAYAHSRGVLHRDLKPSNIMVGSFGEVLVMDWGLVKVLERPGMAPEPGEGEEVVTARTESGEEAARTRAGLVAGTPEYMSPEQARGEVDRLGPPSDVYSLGATLYELLSGQPPRDRDSPEHIPLWVLNGPSPSVRKVLEVAAPLGPHRITIGSPAGSDRMAVIEQDGRIPEELATICERAMALDPTQRYADAGELGREIAWWLDGALREERALQVVIEAESCLREGEVLQAQAEDLRVQARERLSGVKTYEPEELKIPGWRLEDEAERIEGAADLKTLEYVQGLRGALTHASDLIEAHDRLATYYHGQHQGAERRRNKRDAARYELLLKTYDRRQRYASYLKGDGAVSLVTDPEGAEVLLYRFVEENRRLVPKLEQVMGRTPLREAVLAQGSYLLVLRAEGHREVRYPVFLQRGEHWDGVRPGTREPFPVWLPAQDDLEADDCYVPAGWFWSGGDPEAYFTLPHRRMWVEGLVMKQFPVTNREYLVFLNDLVDRGDEEGALRWAPRERGPYALEDGPIIYGRDDGGHFILSPDAEGDIGLPEEPVYMVNWGCAEAFARWRASTSHCGWRLPDELEWEKAARAVDGRSFPWGDATDSSFACILSSHSGRPNLQVVDSYPIDESAYGVRGMGGNTRDWLAGSYLNYGSSSNTGEPAERIPGMDSAGTLRVYRGGAWDSPARSQRCANRNLNNPSVSYCNLGLRLARSI